MAGGGKRVTGAFLGVPPWLPLNLATNAIAPVPGNTSPQWRFWPLLNSIELVGVIQNTFPGGTGNGIFLMYPYRLPAPVHGQEIPIVCQGNTVAPTQSPYLAVNVSGDLQIFNAPVSTTIMSWHGWYSLEG